MLFKRNKGSIQSFKVPVSEVESLRIAAEEVRNRLTPGQKKVLHEARMSKHMPSEVWEDHVRDQQRQAQEKLLASFLEKEGIVKLKQRAEDQQLPAKNLRTYIQDQVIEDIETRKALGIERYGTAVQPFNGRDGTRDLYEELMDAVFYLKQIRVEREEMAEAVAELIQAHQRPALFDNDKNVTELLYKLRDWLK